MPGILIVDDNSSIRRLLRFWIGQTREWYVCGEAENGKIAVEKVKRLRPDAVILDLQMPVMNGLEAAKEIKHLAPETAMVMFTMHASDQLLKDAQAVGIQDVLSKSEDVGENLLEMLRRITKPAGEAINRAKLNA